MKRRRRARERVERRRRETLVDVHAVAGRRLVGRAHELGGRLAAGHGQGGQLERRRPEPDLGGVSGQHAHEARIGGHERIGGARLEVGLQARVGHQNPTVSAPSATIRAPLT